MPFRDDSPFDTRPINLKADLESGNEGVQKPLLPDHEAESEKEVEDSREDEEARAKHGLVKHVHFSESLQRALEEKEWEEEQDEAEERSMSWEEYWKWVKAETKCYANYICPVVLVNACILTLVIMYYWRKDS